MVEPPRVSRSPDAYPASPVSVPFQSTPLCSAKRLSSIETMASFMVLAILSVGTSNRRCEYSQAMVLPFASTIVVTAGTSPSRSCADALPTTSEARLDPSPMPPAIGNSRAATMTLASRQHPASLAIVTAVAGRSDMATTLAALRWESSRVVEENFFLRLVRLRFLSVAAQAAIKRLNRWLSAPLHDRIARSSQKRGLRMLRNWYLTT